MYVCVYIYIHIHPLYIRKYMYFHVEYMRDVIVRTLYVYVCTYIYIYICISSIYT